MAITNLLLTVTVLLALFQQRKLILYAAILITIACAMWQYIIFTPGLLYFAVLAILLYFYYTVYSKKNILNKSLFVLITSLLMFVVIHKIPGFANTLVFNHIQIGNATHTYTMYHNFDKAMSALLVCALGGFIFAEKPLTIKLLRQTIIITIACIAVVLLPALLSGYVTIDFKIPNIFLLWALNNLIFVCFTEAVIFRGFLQNALINYFPNKTKYKVAAIVIASIASGCAHYYGGILYVGLVTLVGLFYGYAYYKTKKIFCAMLVQFLLNMTHFLFFSYPS